MSSLVCVVALTLLYPLNAAARPLSGGVGDDESRIPAAASRSEILRLGFQPPGYPRATACGLSR